MGNVISNVLSTIGWFPGESRNEMVHQKLYQSSIYPVLVYHRNSHANLRYDSINVLTSAAQMGNFINYALNEIYNRLGWCRWWRACYTFTTVSGVALYELPAYVGLIYDIRDMDVGRPLAKKTHQWLNRTDPLRDSTGSSYRYAEHGSGDLGGVVIELNPIPANAVTVLLDYYWRPIPMTEFTDIPFFPPEHLEVIILGALKRGAQYDTSRKAYQEAYRAWRDALSDLMEARRRDMKDGERLITDVEASRSESVSGLGPVTRAEQLQL